MPDGLDHSKQVIELTSDGSATIYLPEMDEHYHSVKGALTESNHIYIECALKASIKKNPRILEIGFGTGLNCVLSALQPDKNIEYFTLELYPLPESTIDLLGYKSLFDETGELIFHKIHNAGWNSPQAITPQFVLHKIKADFTDRELILPADIDVVYFDAFAPEKQPEMWSKESFTKIFESMNEGGILTTYCAKGSIRRLLAGTGFKVERIPGPPNGKREILRATKP